MKQTKGRNLSPRANKVLLVLNIVLFLGAIVLAKLNVDQKEYTQAAAKLFVMFIRGVKIYVCWKRHKEKL